ncbi:MAG: glutamate 5-kinase, partial [Oscillospiraceae bacterium]
IDGFYDDNPNTNPAAKIIPKIDKITDEIRAMACGEGTRRGTGGMRTKLKAAEIVTAANIGMVITNGQNPENLYEIIKGEHVGTLFTRESL